MGEKSGKKWRDFMVLAHDATAKQFKGDADAARRHFTAMARRYFTKIIKADNSCVEAYHELSNCNLPGDPPARALMIAKEAVRLNPCSVEARLNLASRLFQCFRFPESTQELQVAFKLDPNNSEVACSLGGAFCLERRWSEAEEVLVNAPELVGLGWDSLVEAMEAQNKTKEFKKMCEARIKAKPNDSRFCYKLALILQAEGDFAGAIAVAEQLGAHCKNPLERLAILIDLHLAQGLSVRSLELSREAVKLRPGDYGFQHRLMRALKACGDIEGAIIVLTNLGVTGRQELADELINLGRLDEAVVVLRSTLADRPCDRETLSALSEILYARGAQGEVMELWKNYVKGDKDPCALLSFACELKKQGQLPDAVENCLKALKGARKHPEGFVSWLVSDGAGEFLDNIVKLLKNPQGMPGMLASGMMRQLYRLSKVYNELGLLYQEHAQYGSAADAFRKAVNLAPKSPAALCALAEALKSAGDLSGALKTYEAALTLFPKGPLFKMPIFNARERIEAEIVNLRREYRGYARINRY